MTTATDKVKERNKELLDAKQECQEIERRLPAGLLFWYPFREGASILFLLRDKEKYDEPELISVLKNKGLSVSAVTEEDLMNGSGEVQTKKLYDYCIAIGVLEESQHPDQLLKSVIGKLCDEGVLLLGMNNRLGLRWLSGDLDPYTGQIFDGINNYREQWATGRKSQSTGRCYSRAEMEQFIYDAGFNAAFFNPVLPGLEAPQLIYAEGEKPEENLALRYFPYYENPKKVFLEEKELWNDASDNGLFQGLANAYLVECTNNGKGRPSFLHVTLAMDRSREDSQATVIGTDGKVRKIPFYQEGLSKLNAMEEVAQKLRTRGIRVVEGHIDQDTYVMPRIRGENGNLYLRRIFHENQELFFRELDAFRDLVLQSSDTVDPPEDIKERFGCDGLGIWLKEGFPDMVPHNCFHDDDGFLFYDQEFCERTFPANYLLYRLVTLLYRGDSAINKQLPMDALLDRFDLNKQIALWKYYDVKFLGDLRRWQAMESYHYSHDPDLQQIRMNRLRMNSTEEEFSRRYVNIFSGLGKRKIYLFGSGAYAKRYLDYYGDMYPASGLLDNMTEKQGRSVHGLPVLAPDELLSLEPGSFRVIICIRDFESVEQQLIDMDIDDYVVYIPTMDHLANTTQVHTESTPQQELGKNSNEKGMREDVVNKGSKPYHVGYVAGVFDLYHIGHLNLFRRAKEQCDHLIVGVVSDEQVQVSRNKKKATYVPFEERIELVKACRYVDEAVKIPPTAAGIQDMYRKYHFDAMFTGSDYAKDPGWLSAKSWLEERGSTIVFFPYTESTSSSSLKALIDKQLI